MSNSSKRVRGIFALAVGISLSLVAASCGRDDNKDAATTTAAPASSAAPSSSAATASSAPSSSTGSTGSSAAPSSSQETTTSAAAKPGPGDFGSLKDVCGPGDAKGDTDQGVTDTEISVGTPSDVGNTVVPGLNQELWDSADAFVGWCNAAGGINGRKIKLNKLDAKLFEVGARMVEACQTDFFLVGGGMALDDASVEPLGNCGLPNLSGYLVGLKAGVAPLMMSPLPTSNRFSGTGILLRQVGEADSSTKAAFGEWGLQLPSVQPSAERARRSAKQYGFTEKYYTEIPTPMDNWRVEVENLKAAGVQVLSMYGTPENLAVAMKTMNDVGYFPKYIVLEGNFYNDKLIAEAGELLSKSTVLIYTNVVPFEEASAHPAVQQYMDLLKQYANGAKPKSLGVNGFSAWLLFAKSVKECGSDVTRKCVFDKAATAANWDGGGLHAETHPGPATSNPPDCYTILQATPAGFVINKDLAKPNKGVFNCDPSNAALVPEA